MKSQNPSHIFYDPSHNRWKIIKIFSFLLTIFFGIILFALILAIFIDPKLPSINLTQGIKLTTQKPSNQVQLNWSPVDYNLLKRLARQTISPSYQLNTSQTRPEISAVYVNYDENSFISLKENAANLDRILPIWLHLNNAAGEISSDYESKQDEVVSWIRDKRPKMQIMPIIDSQSSNGRPDLEKITGLLVDQTARNRNIDALLHYVKSNNLSGITINFESVPETNLGDYETYLTELTGKFHSNNLKVAVILPFDRDVINYQKISTITDYVVLTTFESKSDMPSIGPISPQVWFESNVEQRINQIPKEKLILMLGNMGYDSEEGSNQINDLTFQEVMTIAKNSNSSINFDKNALNPKFDYLDEWDNLHHIWFLDATTIYNEILAANRFNPGGYALEYLGSEDPSTWSLLDDPRSLNRDEILTIGPNNNIVYKGNGDILRIVDNPQPGKRKITAYQNNLISGEQITTYPTGYLLEKSGYSSGKKFALTFDDGPDQAYTPQILKILNDYNVPATFFVVGMNANLNQPLFRAEVNGKNEIGVHTYTHPNIENISNTTLNLELNATQRLIETNLGRHSILFRPPYNKDAEPTSISQIKPLIETNNMGYYTVSIGIDPRDWEKPGTDVIVQRVLEGASKNEGNLVLLHDSGGDRSQTIQALPKIIEGLQQQGYELVPVSELVGLNRDQAMPVVQGNLSNHLDDYGFLSIYYVTKVFKFIFIVGLFLGISRFLLINFLALFGNGHYKKTKEKYQPPVTVIVPAYNESKVIVKTIKTLLESTYPKLLIYIIDDGSTDNTLGLLLSNFSGLTNISIYTQKNAGKNSALNFGFSLARTEIVITLDADTLLKPNAIEKLVRHFEDNNIGAVAGNAKVGNRTNLLTKMQAIEYIVNQSLDRRAFAKLNAITVVPGAVGAWRKEAVIKCGGFHSDTLAEDADTTLLILTHGYRIKYEDEAIGLTEAPESVKALLRQRFRWIFGTFQVGWKHRRTLFNPKYKNLGFLAIPNILLFQVFFSIIAPIMDLILLGTVIFSYMKFLQHPTDYSWTSLVQLLIYYGIFLVLDLSTALVAFLLEAKENKWLLFYMPLQRFFYRQLIYYIAWRALATALKGRTVNWEQSLRNGKTRLNLKHSLK